MVVLFSMDVMPLRWSWPRVRWLRDQPSESGVVNGRHARLILGLGVVGVGARFTLSRVVLEPEAVE